MIVVVVVVVVVVVIVVVVVELENLLDGCRHLSPSGEVLVNPSKKSSWSQLKLSGKKRLTVSLLPLERNMRSLSRLLRR